MTTQLLTVPLPPPLPRSSSSLITPERLANPLLDASSYSPFPTFPGSSHARDPYGLNAFLMHPSDSLWDYVQPAPAASRTSEDSSPEFAENDANDDAGMVIQRKQSLRKQMSMGSLPHVGGSPLAKEVILGEEQQVTVVRKRSKSVGSTAMLLKELETVSLSMSDKEDIVVEVTKSKTPSVPPKTFRRVLHKARSRFLSPSSTESHTSTGSDTSSPSLVEDADLPIVTYTPTSTTSEVSSSNSSSTSSEGVITPSEPTGDAGVAVAAKLADALEAGVGKKSWLGWLGGKRGHKSKDSSPASSRGPSPTASSINLSPKAASRPHTPPSAPTAEAEAEPEPISRVSPSHSPSPDRGTRTHTWVGAAIRSVSIRKATNLRRPGPHPLAMHIARQHGHLPEEIAFALRGEMQRVYPNSVNLASPSFTPGQGGLRVNLAIRSVLSQLDRGHLPPGTFSMASPKSSGKGDALGMGDFVRRPPFEDRMMVYFANGSFSPISMARPGFGIWDLEYSAQILALASLEVGDGEDSKISRRSSHVEEDKQSGPTSLPNTDVEILVTPPPIAEAVFSPPEIAIPTLPASSTSPPIADDSEAVEVVEDIVVSESSAELESSFKCRSKVPVERPLSSFQNASSRSKSFEWTDSDSDESDEDLVDDDKPLAMVMKRNASMPNVAVPTRTRPMSTLSSLPSGEFASQRTNLQNTSRNSKRLSGVDPQAARKEVAKARERREALLSGEIERRVEAQIEVDKKRSSMPPKRASMSTSNLPLHSSSREKRMSNFQPQSSSSPSSPARNGRDHPRRRPMSTFEIPDPRPAGHVRTSTAPTSSLPNRNVNNRRHHSFYEISHHARPHSQSRRQSAQLLPSQSFYIPPAAPPAMIYHHPAQALFHHHIPAPHHPQMMYAIPHSGPMMVHQTPPPAPPVYGLPPSFSRSSLSLPQKPTRR